MERQIGCSMQMACEVADLLYARILKGLRKIKRPLVLANLIFILYLLAVMPDAEFIQEQTQTILKTYGLSDRGTFTFCASVKEVEQTKNGYSLRLREEQRKFDFLASFKEEPDCLIGNTVEVTGRVYFFARPSNPGQFDEASYYHAEGVLFRFQADSLIIVSDKTNVFSQWLHEKRKALKRIMGNLLPEEDAGILSAVLLGDKSGLQTEVQELYRRNGIAHILAISGLHVSLIGGSFYRLLLRLRCPRLGASLAAAVFLYGYGSMTGFGISALRAVIMMIVSLGAVPAGKTYDLPSSCSLASIIILAQQPEQLYQPGFQLSFAAVAAIAGIYPLLEAIFMEVFSKHIHGWRKKGAEALLLSISVSLLLTPISVWHFYVFSPFSILLNLIVIPLMSLVVLCGAAGAVVGLFSINGGRFLFGSVHVVFQIYELLCRKAEKLPFAQLITGKPAYICMAAYFLILLYCLWRFKVYIAKQKKEKSGKKAQAPVQKRSKLEIMIRFSIIMLLPGLFLIHERRGLLVTVLDVGQGDGIVAEGADKSACIIDCGSSTVKEVGKYRLVPYLKYRGIARIQSVFVSHSDSDHISGIQELINQREIMVEQLVLPETEEQDEVIMEMAEQAETAGISVIYWQAGESCLIGDISLQCLSPEAGLRYDSTNASSMVLCLRYGDFSMLFTGDLEGEGEKSVTDRLLEMEAGSFQVLKAGHHGSKNSSEAAFLDAVSPKLTIISCGVLNRYGHPHPEMLERAANACSEVVSTASSGAVLLQTDGNRVTWRTWINGIESSEKTFTFITHDKRMNE